MDRQSFPRAVTLVEVGPRDGLQHEARPVDTATKIAFIDRLSRTGLRRIESGSFVRPEAILQLADADAVHAGIEHRPGVDYQALVPNRHGLQRAIEAGIRHICIFTAATDGFCQHNIHCDIEASLARYAPLVELARARGMRVRGYLSCVLGCPYEGAVAPARVASLAARLIDIGCDEVSLGDTIGAGTPLTAQTMLEAVAQRIPIGRIAIHFHDTYGQALANILACLETGVSMIDSAVAGLGGCPYAPGASGNVATEDVVYMLEGMHIHTGIDLRQLIETGRFICARLGRTNLSRVATAMQEASP